MKEKQKYCNWQFQQHNKRNVSKNKNEKHDHYNRNIDGKNKIKTVKTNQDSGKIESIEAVKIMSRMTNLQYSKFVKDIDANTNENMSTSSITALSVEVAETKQVIRHSKSHSVKNLISNDVFADDNIDQDRRRQKNIFRPNIAVWSRW